MIGYVKEKVKTPRGTWAFCFSSPKLYVYDYYRRIDISKPTAKVDHLWTYMPDEFEYDSSVVKRYAEMDYVGVVDYYTRSNGEVDLAVNPVQYVSGDWLNLCLKKLRTGQSSYSLSEINSFLEEMEFVRSNNIPFIVYHYHKATHQLFPIIKQGFLSHKHSLERPILSLPDLTMANIDQWQNSFKSNSNSVKPCL